MTSAECVRIAIAEMRAAINPSVKQSCILCFEETQKYLKTLIFAIAVKIFLIKGLFFLKMKCLILFLMYE